MTPLKVKCSICGKEESNQDLIKEVSNIIEKYGLKAEHYLHLLNVMSGKCMDSDEHSFIFDETFLKEMEEFTIKHKANLAEISTLKDINEGLRKEADELIIKTKELNSKCYFNNYRINNISNSIPEYENEIKEATKCSNIEIWY